MVADRDGELWHSFCRDLEKYVGDESLASAESTVVVVFSKSEVKVRSCH